jgi:hypothetical protein
MLYRVLCLSISFHRVDFAQAENNDTWARLARESSRVALANNDRLLRLTYQSKDHSARGSSRAACGGELTSPVTSPVLFCVLVRERERAERSMGMGMGNQSKGKQQQRAAHAGRPCDPALGMRRLRAPTLATPGAAT